MNAPDFYDQEKSKYLIDNFYRDYIIKIMEDYEKQSNEELKSLVKEMRSAQNEYFRTRDKQVLVKSKELEAKVDSLLSGQKQIKF